MLSKKKILVTGGAGYIGSHVVEILIKNKFEVVIIDNLSTGSKKLIHKKAYFIKSDITNKKKILSIIKKNNISSIVHLAASLNISEAEKNKKKYYKNNIVGTKNLLDACKYYNIENFIFSSSCAVYGNVNGSVKESKKPNPKSYYGYSKYLGEKLILNYSKKNKFNYAILRYFNVAGASKSGKIGELETSHGHLIKNLSIQAKKKNPKIEIYGNNYKTKDGTCVRDYMHVCDLADIHLKAINYLLQTKKSFIINSGYGHGYSVLQIVKKFKKIKKKTSYFFKERRPGDVDQVFANTDRLKRILKFKPKFNNIETILKSAIAWEKKITKNF